MQRAGRKTKDGRGEKTPKLATESAIFTTLHAKNAILTGAASRPELYRETGRPHTLYG